MIDLDPRWDANKRRDEAAVLRTLAETADLDAGARARG